MIPHEQQRYDTEGDWQSFGDDLLITVSEKPDLRKCVAIAIHEIVEAVLCSQAGITQEQVDAWDMSHLDVKEPGDLPDAPYNRQHCVASIIEDLLTLELHGQNVLLRK